MAHPPHHLPAEVWTVGVAHSGLNLVCRIRYRLELLLIPQARQLLQVGQCVRLQASLSSLQRFPVVVVQPSPDGKEAKERHLLELARQ